MTTSSAFAAYEAVRHRLPDAVASQPVSLKGDSLDNISDLYDAFFLDAFGVLNIGETAIPGVADRINALRAKGKRVLIVSNAAGFPHAVLEAKYKRLGFSFEANDIITSRAALMHEIDSAPVFHWGLMATRSAGLGELAQLNLTYLEEDPAHYDQVDGFLMIGSAAWTTTRQTLLEQALQDKARPVWVGNPDIVAPRETGFSTEPGNFAHQLADCTGVKPKFFGKPFQSIYALAFKRIDPSIPHDRVVMVGDSLHTDILGAQNAGIKSALIANYGFFGGTDVEAYIKKAGIHPDHILARP